MENVRGLTIKFALDFAAAQGSFGHNKNVLEVNNFISKLIKYTYNII